VAATYHVRKRASAHDNKKRGARVAGLRFHFAPSTVGARIGTTHVKSSALQFSDIHVSAESNESNGPTTVCFSVGAPIIKTCGASSPM
jgi:hypothetical protein